MTKPCRQPPPAKLFMALMHRPHFDPEPLLGRLAGRYGRVDARSDPQPFGSSYYESEMGPGLVKFFVSFEPLIPQERLADVKRETNELEAREADAAGRVCNLDPGLVTHYSVIMATTKGYAHRIYLGQGIYAEATLLFQKGALQALPWTYPDFRSPAAQDFLAEARRLLRLEQRSERQRSRPPVGARPTHE
jgi:hypothetical protein